MIEIDSQYYLKRLIKFQTKEDIKKIFSLDFDVEYFIKIIEILDFIHQEKLMKEKTLEEFIFIFNFLKSFVFK